MLKKGVALQFKWQPSTSVAPISSESDASVTTFAQGAPSEVTEQSVTFAIPLPMAGRMGLPTALVASTVVGAEQPVVTLLTQVEVAVAVIDGS